MLKYQKKPVVIEAVQWNGEITDELMAICKTGIVCVIIQSNEMKIKTLDGTMTASLGDFIIKGVKDELYLCKPDIFEATYEIVRTPDTWFDPSGNYH